MAAAVLAVSCSSSDGAVVTYPNSDELLGAANAANMACACLFVMKMSDSYCEAWVKVSPDLPRYSVDREHQRVVATVLVGWSASARYLDAHRGCLLE